MHLDSAKFYVFIMDYIFTEIAFFLGYVRDDTYSISKCIKINSIEINNIWERYYFVSII